MPLNVGKKSRKKGTVNESHEMVEKKRQNLAGTKSVSFSESESLPRKEKPNKMKQKKLSSDEDPVS